MGLSTYLKSSMRRHWKLLGLIAIIVIAMASTTYAYWLVNAPSSATLYVTATYPPLELRMELEKTEFQQGEEIPVHLSLRNLNDEQVNITFCEMGHYVDFRVLDKKNTEVFIYYAGALTALDEVILGPYDQIDRTFPWTQISNRPGEYDGKQVPAGTYKIIGFTGCIIQIDLEEFIPAFQFETPPMEITIS